jgi:hypothetical protein
MIPRGVEPHSPASRLLRAEFERAGYGLTMEPRSGPLPIYPDRRIMPRTCNRTGMRRYYCCCAPCRALRRRKHRAACRCWLCYADRMGGFIDRLGRDTGPGRWAIFLTATFRTPRYPWTRGFPVEQPEPHPDFVHHFVGRMICWLETALHERVEFFCADQYGERGGRLHQHAGLTSPGLVRAAEELAAMRRADPKTTRLPEVLKPFASMLVEKAGLNRIHPWEEDAAYYIGRYLGRDARRCHWDWRVGQKLMPADKHSVGRVLVVNSPVPCDSSDSYRLGLSRWHR